MSKRTKQAKKKGNKLAFIISLLLITLSVVLLYPVGKELSTILNLRAQLKESKVLLEAIEKENLALTEQKSKLNDPEYIKSYARGEYLLSKEGEQIFKLPSKK